eukprot:4951985-Karenia_brevis.AAC.1
MHTISLIGGGRGNPEKLSNSKEGEKGGKDLMYGVPKPVTGDHVLELIATRLSTKNAIGNPILSAPGCYPSPQ